MNVLEITDLTDTLLIDFLKNNLSKIEDMSCTENYHPDFSNKPGNLFYILKEGRYVNGKYYILEQEGEYLGSAGWNPYNDVALLLTRAYIPPRFRKNYFMAEYLLPKMFEETKDYDKLWITCNDYNSVIYNAFVRLSQGKPAGIFNKWPSVYKKFIPIGKRIVNYTEQYVAEYKR